MSQELAVLEVAEVLSVSNVTPGLFAPNGLDAAIARIRERVAGHVPDVSTERGRKEIAALSRRVASSKVYLDDMGKALVSGIKAQAVVIDAERKRMRDELDALRDEVRRPLTEYEDRERMRIEEHEDAISSIIEAGVSACPALSKEETNRLIALVNGLAGRDWQEFVQRGQKARIEALERINGADAERVRLDGERDEAQKRRIAEAERLQAERDERIRVEAEQKAKRDLEQRERQAAEAVQQAERKAELDKAIAEEKARNAEAAAERARQDAANAVEAERKRVADQEAKAAAEVERREANRRHCAKVNRAVVVELMALGLSEQQAKSVVTAIAKSEIANLRIAY